jgi:hypothetical protein
LCTCDGHAQNRGSALVSPQADAGASQQPEVGPARLAQAAADRLRSDMLATALGTWEAEDGPFDDDELDAAAAALGITSEATT